MTFNLIEEFEYIPDVVLDSDHSSLHTREFDGTLIFIGQKVWV